ncbi:hypothetical protein BJY52DRAFT_151044 [Lactarius psammicola]|nr:hypothetical protein BJY52DRAFT_151044 [Lactarius psammicola]
MLDGYFLFTDKMHFHPCLLFHGVSTALCATLSSSGTLHSLLCFSIVFRLWCTQHSSHSFTRISLACFASVSLVLVFAGAPCPPLCRQGH